MGGIIAPSLKRYARNAGESAHPELWNGLVGAWVPALGVQGGTLFDISGRGNHGTLTNMDPATDWVVGGNGVALRTDGVNESISCGQNVGTLGASTLSFWAYIKFNVLPTGGSSQNHIIGRWGGADGPRVIACRIVNSTTARILTENTSQLFSDITIPALVINRWYFMLFVYDSGGGAFYLDGRKEGSFSGLDTSLRTSSSASFTIGEDSSGFGDTNADWGAMYLWKGRALGESHAITLANHPLAPFELKRRPVFRVPVVAGGRIMSSLVACGGLAGCGGIAGRGGGLAA